MENKTVFVNNANENDNDEMLQTDSFDEFSKPSLNEILERQKVLILTLETSCRNYQWSWAKQPIESIVETYVVFTYFLYNFLI